MAQYVPSLILNIFHILFHSIFRRINCWVILLYPCSFSWEKPSYVIKVKSFSHFSRGDFFFGLPSENPQWNDNRFRIKSTAINVSSCGKCWQDNFLLLSTFPDSQREVQLQWEVLSMMLLVLYQLFLSTEIGSSLPFFIELSKELKWFFWDFYLCYFPCSLFFFSQNHLRSFSQTPSWLWWLSCRELHVLLTEWKWGSLEWHSRLLSSSLISLFSVFTLSFYTPPVPDYFSTLGKSYIC